MNMDMIDSPLYWPERSSAQWYPRNESEWSREAPVRS